MHNSVQIKNIYDYLVTLIYDYMEKSKLISLLKTFNKDEIKSFNDFVSSPFFNKEKVLIRLTGYLQNNHPDYNNSGIEKEKVYSFLYPGKNYSDGLMRNVISDLYRLAEEFLAVNNLRNNSIKENMLLLDELNNRKLYSQFLKLKEKTEGHIEKSGFKNELYFERKIELTKLYRNYLNEVKDSYIKWNEGIQDLSDLITANFLVNMLFINIFMVNKQSNILNITYRINFSRELESFLENEGKSYLDIPYIESFYLAFKLVKSEDENYFYKLKYFLELKFEVLNDFARKNIYTVLQNYAHSHVVAGNTKFVKELFLLHKESVESNTLKGISSFIRNVYFTSIVVTGYEAGEFDWVEKFINKYISEVKEDLRTDTLHFCRALRSFWDKDYENALNELALVTSEEISFKHNVKSLTLKIYFELNETEPFYSHIDSYKHFILKNKNIYDKLREQVNNYINFSKKLFDLKNRGDSEKGMDLEILNNDIKTHTALINKIWLLRKAEEISG